MIHGRDDDKHDHGMEYIISDFQSRRSSFSFTMSKVTVAYLVDQLAWSERIVNTLSDQEERLDAHQPIEKLDKELAHCLLYFGNIAHIVVYSHDQN